MNAGKLRHRVTIQNFSEQQDPYTGEITKKWSDMSTVWAQVAPLSVREFIAAAAEQGEVTTRITIRKIDNLTNQSRILFRGKTYNIHGVLPDNVSGLDYLSLATSEGVNDG